MGRQEEKHQLRERTEEPRGPPKEQTSNAFQEYFRTCMPPQGDDRMQPCLLEAKHGVTENIQ